MSLCFCTLEEFQIHALINVLVLLNMLFADSSSTFVCMLSLLPADEHTIVKFLPFSVFALRKTHSVSLFFVYDGKRDFLVNFR